MYTPSEYRPRRLTETKLASLGAPWGGPASLGASLAPPGGWESEFFEKRKAHAKYGAKYLELSKFQAHFGPTWMGRTTRICIFLWFEADFLKIGI